MSVGLYKMFDNFWTNSMLVKPNDGRKVVCHPTAWDMGNREDFRWDEVKNMLILTHIHTDLGASLTFYHLIFNSIKNTKVVEKVIIVDSLFPADKDNQSLDCKISVQIITPAIHSDNICISVKYYIL